jgi:NAD(P)-dependent dehydrogenase (short-subunit alcohol dehydrogenase family)
MHRGSDIREMRIMSKPVCAVVGVGPGNGAALARRFSEGGHAVALLARSEELSGKLAGELPAAKAYKCDVGDAADIERAFSAVRQDMGAVETLIYNAGAAVWGSVEEISAADFEIGWRINALGAFLAAQKVIPAMKEAGYGNIVFIGATASRRGGPKSAGFASAKAAQRSLAESMARHLWPAGIHVSLIIIDGVIDLERTRKRMPDKPEDFFLQASDIAETVWQTTQQNRSAWSFEVEARPFGEVW